ncbi:MAG: hypothetical protein ACXVP3_04105 [Actinomycetota bacterium]
MSDERPGEEPQLEEEGIPDLEGPLPSKVRTGDGQEGIIPPDEDWIAADEFGTTAAEQLRGEPLTARLREEQPDEPPPLDERDDPAQLTQPGDTEPDEEPALVADEWFEDLPGEPAEEDAVRAVSEDEVPGAVDAPSDGYEEESA